MKVPELDSRSKKLLAAGATLALGAATFRSLKTEGDHLTFDFSVWGEKSKQIYADVIDDTKQAYGRITGRLVLNSNNEVENVEDIEFTESGAEPVNRVLALEKAVAEKEGWTGQKTKGNSLQER